MKLLKAINEVLDVLLSGDQRDKSWWDEVVDTRPEEAD